MPVPAQQFVRTRAATVEHVRVVLPERRKSLVRGPVPPQIPLRVRPRAARTAGSQQLFDHGNLAAEHRQFVALLPTEVNALVLLRHQRDQVRLEVRQRLLDRRAEGHDIA